MADWRARHRGRFLGFQQRHGAAAPGSNAPLRRVRVVDLCAVGDRPCQKVPIQGPPGRPGLLHPAGTAASAPDLQTAVLVEPTAVPVVAGARLRRHLRPVFRLRGQSQALPRKLQFQNPRQMIF